MDDLLQDEEQEYLVITMVASPIFGILLYRILLLVRLSQNSSEKMQWAKHLVFAAFAPWQMDFYEGLTKSLITEDEKSEMILGNSPECLES